MKNFRKLLSVILIITMIFAFSGCFFNECSLCGEEGDDINPVKKRKYYGKERYMCELCWLGYMVDLREKEVEKYY